MARHRRPWSLRSLLTSLRVSRPRTVPAAAHRGLPVSLPVAPAWPHRSEGDRGGEFADPAAALPE